MNNQVAIAIGLALGLAVGIVAEISQVEWLLGFANGVTPIGTLFINLVRMVVIPLVVTTLFTGVASMSNPRALGRLGGTAVLFFWVTTFIAIAIGMAVMGLSLGLSPVQTELPVVDRAPPELPTVVDFLIGLVPANPFEAAASGALLPLIVFTAFFGAAAGTLPGNQKQRLLDLSQSVTAALIKLVHWVLLTAPLGVFALAAPVAAAAGLDLLRNLFVFVVAVALGLVIFIAAVYIPAVLFLGRVSPMRFVRASWGPQVIGASTTSSAATLPAMLEAAVERLGISEMVAGLVLAVGASINRAGSALFQGGCVIFLAAIYGVDLTAADVGAAFIATFFVSMTVAGVPSASLVTLAPALEIAGVPVAGISLLFGIDRIPDMLRSATNVTGHLATSTIVEQVARRSET